MKPLDSANIPKQPDAPLLPFRVHYADGTKITVHATDPQAARKRAEDRRETAGVKIVKVKLDREAR